MIFAPWDEAKRYLHNPALLRQLPKIDALLHDAKDGEHTLDGSDIFVKVLSYETKCDDFITESHRAYIDIQIVTHGVEGIEVMLPSALHIRRPYEPADDCTFYEQTPFNTGTRINLVPGWFGLFFPHDAHKTQIALNNSPSPLRKIVVKVHEKFFP